jgi:hypothetical protein
MFGMWIDFILVVIISSIIITKLVSYFTKKQSAILAAISFGVGIMLTAVISVSMILYPAKTEYHEIKKYEWSQFDTTYTKSYRNITQTTVEHFRILKISLKDNQIVPFDNNDNYTADESDTIFAKFRNPKIVFSDSIKSILYIRKFNIYNKLLLPQIFIEISDNYFVSETNSGELLKKR